jgi:glycosyltransferase involved in cell wall biosynthesis
MRICHVIESAGGGSSQVVLDLAEYGARHGDDVTVIYAPDRASSHFVKTLEALRGIKRYTTPMRRAVGVHDLLGAWKLWRLLHRIGPFDVVHSHSSKAGALARLVGFLFMGRRAPAQIYTPHAFVTMAPDASKAYGMIERILSWFSTTIITLSAVEECHARDDLGIAPSKLAVVPNGIVLDYPADRATARQSLGWQNNEFIVGVVGRLVAQKNPLRAIEAFQLLAAQNPMVRLAILGDGPLQNEVDEALAQPFLAGKAKRIEGQKGRDLMPDFDVLLCASDYEGFAITFLEALAAGVPIVTTRVGGAEEAVREGVSGFIAEATPEALAAALTRIANMTNEERTMLSASTRQLAEEFTIEAMGKRTKEVYEKALLKHLGAKGKRT